MASHMKSYLKKMANIHILLYNATHIMAQIISTD